MSENEQPTTEELAKELEATETESPETAPDSAPDPAEPEAPAEPPDAPDPPAPDPEPDPPGGDGEAEPEKTIAPPVRSAAQTSADKKKADGTRRKTAIADAATPELPVDEAEEKRKSDIYDGLEEVQAELEEAQAVVESCKARARDLMAELYPHTVGSDKLVDAVRGHIAAQKVIRKNRASNPARIAEILKAAGRSPIDQAFAVQRARGMARPTRGQPAPAAAATGDQGDGSNANAGSE